jgi:4-aminobutyrate aminotransferase-like enzyme
VVDETRTGVAITGKMWGHENWYLQQAPDVVSFTTRGFGGFFAAPSFGLPDVDELVLDKNIDVANIFRFGTTWKYIQRWNLLNYVNDTSTFLKIEL